jgi:hypothetical protein
MNVTRRALLALCKNSATAASLSAAYLAQLAELLADPAATALFRRSVQDQFGCTIPAFRGPTSIGRSIHG